MLTLVQYFAKRSLSNRRRTIEFAFNTAHLHISREGTARHAEQLNDAYEKEEDKSVEQKYSQDYLKGPRGLARHRSMQSRARRTSIKYHSSELA